MLLSQIPEADLFIKSSIEGFSLLGSVTVANLPGHHLPRINFYIGIFIFVFNSTFDYTTILNTFKYFIWWEKITFTHHRSNQILDRKQTQAFDFRANISYKLSSRGNAVPISLLFLSFFLFLFKIAFLTLSLNYKFKIGYLLSWNLRYHVYNRSTMC